MSNYVYFQDVFVREDAYAENTQQWPYKFNPKTGRKPTCDCSK